MAFVVRRPKVREILAADFADRVVHHLLVPRLERQFEPVFIHDCFSNRRGKGTHGALERLQHFMQRAKDHAKKCQQRAHYLQLDVANFFNSIDRRCLFGLVQARLARDLRRGASDPRHIGTADAADLLWLTRCILTGNAASGAILRGTAAEFARVPPHKRLINAAPETGIPIGNLTSQFFANVYLNELDQFVKHTLRCQYYVRYVDDMVLLHHDPAVLLDWRDRIAEFLTQRLGLRLRDDGRLRPVADGVDFLGYVQRPDYRLVRRRVVAHLRERLDQFERQIGGAQGAWRFPPDTRTLFAMLASYLGHFRHANSHRLMASLWQRYAWLRWLVRLDDGGHLLPTHSARGVCSMRGQWRYFCKQFAPACVLMQVGTQVELHGVDTACMSQWSDHGGTPVVRHGWPGTGLAWPLARRDAVLQGLTRQGVAWVYVDEQGWLKSGALKQRALRRLFQPDQMALPLVDPACHGQFSGQETS